jgi:hypothetical protein
MKSVNSIPSLFQLVTKKISQELDLDSLDDILLLPSDYQAAILNELDSRSLINFWKKHQSNEEINAIIIAILFKRRDPYANTELMRYFVNNYNSNDDYFPKISRISSAEWLGYFDRLLNYVTSTLEQRQLACVGLLKLAHSSIYLANKIGHEKTLKHLVILTRCNPMLLYILLTKLHPENYPKAAHFVLTEVALFLSSKEKQYKNLDAYMSLLPYLSGSDRNKLLIQMAPVFAEITDSNDLSLKILHESPVVLEYLSPPIRKKIIEGVFTELDNYGRRLRHFEDYSITPHGFFGKAASYLTKEEQEKLIGKIRGEYRDSSWMRECIDQAIPYIEHPELLIEEVKGHLVFYNRLLDGLFSSAHIYAIKSDSLNFCKVIETVSKLLFFTGSERASELKDSAQLAVDKIFNRDLPQHFSPYTSIFITKSTQKIDVETQVDTFIDQYYMSSESKTLPNVGAFWPFLTEAQLEKIWKILCFDDDKSLELQRKKIIGAAKTNSISRLFHQLVNRGKHEDILKHTWLEDLSQVRALWQQILARGPRAGQEQNHIPKCA